MTSDTFRASTKSVWPVATLIIAVLGVASNATARGESPEGFAYVLLAPGAPDGSGGPLRALARVIIGEPQARCPRLSPGGFPMAVRTNPNPATFPVTVCEAIYPFDHALTVDGFGITLPTVPRRQPTAVVVIGDSGCLNDSQQDCATDWPFAALVRAAVNEHPDLVIHVGDYNYRGTPGKVGGEDVYDGCATTKYVSQNPADKPDSASWDTWKHWRDDFFKPAAPLTAKAAWVFARGNHELCSRAGPGYFYFLDPHSSLLGHEPTRYQCPAQVNGGAPLSNLTFVPPYALAFDAGLTLLVMDSANACDTADPVTSALSIYAAQFGQIQSLIRTPYAWVVGHRPIWAVAARTAQVDCAEKPADCLNATLQRALAASPGGSLPATVRLLVSGHMHLFQAFTFATPGRPPQLVIGDGGVQLDSVPVPGFAAQNVDGQRGSGVQLRRFGFFNFGLSLTLATDGTWRGQLLDGSGVLAVCGPMGMTTTGSVCRLTGD